jgi:hypothetical protein
MLASTQQSTILPTIGMLAALLSGLTEINLHIGDYT